MDGGPDDPTATGAHHGAIDLGPAEPGGLPQRRRRLRIAGAVATVLLVLGGIAAAVLWAGSGDGDDAVVVASDDTPTSTTSSTSTTVAETTPPSTEPTVPAAFEGPVAPVAPVAGPSTTFVAPPPAPSPPAPSEPEGYEPPGDSSVSEQRGLPRGSYVPHVGEPIYLLGSCPCYNAAGQSFGGGPQTSPDMPGLDFTAVMDGLTIIGWHKVGDTDDVRPAPGAAPLGMRMYDSDGVTVIGYH